MQGSKIEQMEYIGRGKGEVQREQEEDGREKKEDGRKWKGRKGWLIGWRRRDRRQLDMEGMEWMVRKEGGREGRRK